MDINNFYKQCVAGLNATCCNGDDVTDEQDIRNWVKTSQNVKCNFLYINFDIGLN